VKALLWLKFVGFGNYLKKAFYTDVFPLLMEIF